MYNKLMYPAGSYQIFGNKTYGCICNLQACLKKCCKQNEILGEGDRPNCTILPNVTYTSDLVLEQHQLATEIQGISGISDLFVLVEDIQCPENRDRYMLEPKHFKEDAFILQANGTLQTSMGKFLAWSYCLEWKESFENVVALVCLSTDRQIDSSDTEKTFNVGIMVSIPFFFATFFVYAIIPELRNLYGKTLMCYVACLVLAYTFLVLAKLFYFKFVFCSTIGCFNDLDVLGTTGLQSLTMTGAKVFGFNMNIYLLKNGNRSFGSFD
ncbi:G-protein coupled receptor Mth2 [Eufriesea mexicana]|nr:G-protein coupled receptor Mth2 [Eufriesea mexicana]